MYTSRCVGLGDDEDPFDLRERCRTGLVGEIGRVSVVLIKVIESFVCL